MDIQPPVGSHMQRWLNPRYRQGQDFYNGVANLEKVSSQRPFITPTLFLVIKHYADRFNLVEYFNRIIIWDEKQWKL
ncbi:MAG: hypothetical protein PHF64_09485, partial [Methanoregula sp.]|nr:hypothetical protein [Methanoregula sp.]